MTSRSARPACTEDSPLRPSSPYSASKAGGDMQVLAYVRTYGVDACITRGANNYGSRQYPEKFLPLFITNAFDGEPLPVYGDGRQRREWLHADDYSSAIELVLRKAPAGEVYNVGGQECENMDVVRRILDLTGASPDLVRHVTDRPGHDRRYAVDSSKVRWRSAGSRRTRSDRAASRRPSSGTASTATGGSRSSRASTATTTTTSTASSPAESGHPKGAGGPRKARCYVARWSGGLLAAATIAALGLGGVASAALFSAPSSAPPPPATSVTDATSTDSSVIVLTGHGYGHGIGMGQWGAYGYALHGWSAARSSPTTTRARHRPGRDEGRPRAARRRRGRGDGRLAGAVEARRRGRARGEASRRPAHGSALARAPRPKGSSRRSP